VKNWFQHLGFQVQLLCRYTECASADVRIFSQKAVQWGFETKVAAPKDNKPVDWQTWFGNYYHGDGSYVFPTKERPEQVYFYFSHEAVGAWSYQDLGSPETMSQVDYLALSGKPGTSTGSAVWWSFGPTVGRLQVVEFSLPTA
jgi:hypothetical protein